MTFKHNILPHTNKSICLLVNHVKTTRKSRKNYRTDYVDILYGHAFDYPIGIFTSRYSRTSQDGVRYSDDVTEQFTERMYLINPICEVSGASDQRYDRLLQEAHSILI